MIIGIGIMVLAYFFFSLAFFGDKLILSGPPNAKLYTFYVGALNILALVLLPFISWHFGVATFAWAALAGATSLLGIYLMFTALERFEVSRVMSTIGAIQPVAVLVFSGLFWGFGAISNTNLAAFMLLLAGSIVISVEKKLKVTVWYLALTVCSSLLFSLAYIFSKLVFLQVSFLEGLALIGACTFLLAMVFLLDRSLRKEMFPKKNADHAKIGLLFLFTQSAGGIANILQSFAIALVPVSYLAILNALRGVQYVFLFVITLFFSLFYPKILKEDISLKIITQKTVAILLIVLGLVILVVY